MTEPDHEVADIGRKVDTSPTQPWQPRVKGLLI
jgi:hypothetical protein